MSRRFIVIDADGMETEWRERSAVDAVLSWAGAWLRSGADVRVTVRSVRGKQTPFWVRNLGDCVLAEEAAPGGGAP
jgi:hypothetical protein